MAATSKRSSHTMDLVCNHCGGQMNQTTDDNRCMKCGSLDETTCGDCGLRLYTDTDALLCKCEPDFSGIQSVGITCLLCGKRHKPFDENDDTMPCECELAPGQEPPTIQEFLATKQIIQ